VTLVTIPRSPMSNRSAEALLSMVRITIRTSCCSWRPTIGGRRNSTR
jgi:hypothetical protein